MCGTPAGSRAPPAALRRQSTSRLPRAVDRRRSQPGGHPRSSCPTARPRSRARAGAAPARSTSREHDAASLRARRLDTSTPVSRRPAPSRSSRLLDVRVLGRQRAAAAHAQRRDLDVDVLRRRTGTAARTPARKRSALEAGCAAALGGDRRPAAVSACAPGRRSGGRPCVSTCAVAGIDAVGVEQPRDHAPRAPSKLARSVVEIGRASAHDVRVDDVVRRSSRRRQPSADVTPGMRGTTTRGICSPRASVRGVEAAGAAERERA